MIAVALAVVLLVVAALCTAAATSVRSVSRIWLRHWAEQCLRGSDAAALYLERPQRLLLAASAGLALCAAAIGAVLVARGGSLAIRATSLAGAAVALVLLGQIVPHAIARRWPSRLVPALLPLLSALSWLTSPAQAAGRRLARRWHSGVPRTEGEAVRDELEELLRDSELEGIGESGENEIIAGVVRFGETEVRDVMTPRTAIVAAAASTARRELGRLVAESGYSRVPIYRGSLDDVTGVVHVLDLFGVERPLEEIVRPVAFAGPSDPCSDLLVRMLARRQHLAIVRGDTGAVLGLVTLEDLLETLVGDIHDEHDEHPEREASTSTTTR